MPIHSSGQTVLSLSHIEGITLGADEEVDEVAGGANIMGLDRIGEVGNRARKDRLLARFYSRVSGKERSQGWVEGDGE